MFPASCTMNGMCMGFPDVCLTPAPPAPPIPVPYPNIAQVTMVNPGTASMKVKIMNMPAVSQNSQIPISNGDEAGVSGGVVSGQFIGPATFKMGSMKVKWDGKPACFLTSMVGQNGASPNVPAGQQIVPSQAVVIISP
ncbi:MAG: DUF4150 domain-containing protein [Planctomycetes bacterium]|nr:DUF4150 domain-containing protein [Planctomycetota bacterium]